MAVWQFVMEPISQKWAKENSYSTKYLWNKDHNMYDTSGAWQDVQLPTDLFDKFSKILPLSETYEGDLLFGESSEHDISVLLEDNQICSIRFRIDVRQDFTRFMKDIVLVTQQLKCVLFLPQQDTIIQPDIFILGEAITKSNAVKFVECPISFLQNLSTNYPTQQTRQPAKKAMDSGITNA